MRSSVVFILALPLFPVMLPAEAPPQPLGRIAQAVLPENRNAAWAVIETVLASPQNAPPRRDCAYAFSLIKHRMLNPDGPIPEDSAPALAITSGWFAGLYNRYTPFMYISAGPVDDVLLPALLSQYYMLLLYRIEKIEPERVARLIPLAVAVSLMSWLDASPVEIADIYPELGRWAADLSAAGLRPGAVLILKLGSGPAFPGNVPAAELARFHEISLPLDDVILRRIPANRRLLYSAQEVYAFRKGLAWLEPIALVLENIYELGMGDSALAALKARIEIARTVMGPKIRSNK